MVGREEEVVEVEGLLLSHKGLAAAEGYLVARFHLYLQVYLHKTTRAAERMLAALLTRMVNLSKAGEIAATGLNDDHPLVKYFTAENPSSSSYLSLDDTIIWSAIAMMALAKDSTIANMAIGLRDRRLYKCADIGEKARKAGGNSLPRFKKLLQDVKNKPENKTILTDEIRLTAYGVHEYEDPEALKKVLIRRPDSDESDDVQQISDIVGSLKARRLYRVYCESEVEIEQIGALWEEAQKHAT